MKEQDVELVNVSGSIWQKHEPRVSVGVLPAPGFSRSLFAGIGKNPQTLLQASPKPHVLDDYTVGRVFEVFGSQKDDLWLFEEQLARWKMDKLSVGQRHEVDRLTEQVGRCRTVIDSILSLAEQLKEGTIRKGNR
jgi:hypothetical protein